MCTVVGYVGKSFCSAFIFEGLARLEYRGYDSAGFACLDPINQKLLYSKSSGQLINLVERVQRDPIDGFLGIGHTRWSTHGDTSQENAHPHFDCFKNISVVHNGIVENHDVLRSQLLKSGHIFSSDTDTEVIAHLFEDLAHTSIIVPSSISAIMQQLHGAYAFLVMMESFPEYLIAVRKRSPLCVGIGDGEMFVASDVIAFSDKTNKVIFLPDESFAVISKKEIKIYDFAGNELPVVIQAVAATFERSEKNGYEHFMLKEIYEQRNAIIKTVNSLQALQPLLWNQLALTVGQVQNIAHIYLLACGTSWHAARIAQFFFEAITHVPVTVCLASEFRHASFFAQKNALYVVISQSGETADTLEALRLINAYGLSTVALTNVATSTIVREANGFLLTHAGPEVAVASTKAFSTQLASLYWLAHYIAVEKGVITHKDLLRAECDLFSVAHVLESSLEQHKYAIDHIHAACYAQFDKALFLGRHISYPLAMESALKLKEVAYVFAESYPAGELKHGPLALVDNNMPVYVFSHGDPVIYQKLLSNAHEVKARGGRVIVFAYEGQTELCALAETSFIISNNVPALLGPLAIIGLVQYFVYAIAKERGCPIDKPRNLAKSVTVE
ncbi:MAG TPA: glutamine--fructose-6-phosphate transaminase (isomerizing) [Candidatus Babeliales bacterium]|nr:glutamine--fructose-6-phosphate transaminase (isomerizing) [Candidatus Babeliales bacterium]